MAGHSTYHCFPAHIGAPHLVWLVDLEPSQQVGVLPVALVWDRGARPTPDRLLPHIPPQPLQALAVYHQPMVPLQHRHQTAAPQTGILQIDLIQKTP